MNVVPPDHPAKESLKLAWISFLFAVFGVVLAVPTEGILLILVVVGFIGSLLGFGAAFKPLWNRSIARKRRFMAMGIGMLANLPMIALGIAFPFIVAHVHGESYRSSLKSNGKNMYVVAYAGAMDGHPDSFASSALDASATAYCQRLRGAELLAVTPDFVAGLNQPRANSWPSLAPENVGWCFVADLSADSPAGTPFAFSSNLTATNTSQLVGRVGDHLDPEHRSGNKRLIAIFHGGGSHIYRASDPWALVFPDGFSNTAHRILQP